MILNGNDASNTDTHTHKIDGELDREKYWDKSWCEQSKRQNNERMKKEGKNRKWISLSRLSSFNERETIADNSYLCRSINNNKKADIKTKLESYFKTSFVDMFSVNNFFSFDTIDRFFLALLVYVFQSKLFFFLELFFFSPREEMNQCTALYTLLALIWSIEQKCKFGLFCGKRNIIQAFFWWTLPIQTP